MGLFDFLTGGGTSAVPQQGLPPEHSAGARLLELLGGMTGISPLSAVGYLADQPAEERYNEAVWPRFKNMLAKSGVQQQTLDNLEAMPIRARIGAANQLWQNTLKAQKSQKQAYVPEMLPSGQEAFVDPMTGRVLSTLPQGAYTSSFKPNQSQKQRSLMDWWMQSNPSKGPDDYERWLAQFKQKGQEPKYRFSTEYEGTKAFSVARDPVTGNVVWRQPAGNIKPSAQAMTALDESETAQAGLKDILTTGKAVLPAKEGLAGFVTPERLALKARMGDPDVADFNSSKIALIAHLRAVAGAARVNETEIAQVNNAIANANSYEALQRAISRASGLLNKSTAILRKNMGMPDSGASSLPPGLPDMSGVGTPVYGPDGKVIGFTK